MNQSLEAWAGERPLMIYDGDCAFCRARVERWREAVGSQIDFVPFREAAAKLPQIPVRDFRRAVHFIDTGGHVSRGAEAVFRAMASCNRKRWLLWSYLTLPPFAFAAELVYRFIADNRGRIAWVYRTWHGDLDRSTYHIASAIFLRLLGMVYFIAFVSLWAQIDGLIGDKGILPTADFLAAVKQGFAQQPMHRSAIWNVPTLAWISPHNGSLHALCSAGTISAVLLILGIVPIVSLITLWTCYLSLVFAGQDFMSFQWDILLLETGFAAMFVAPFVVRSGFLKDRHPPRLAIWLIWWLLFRLMFESGTVKLTWNAWPTEPGGKPLANTWSLLTALDYHYWTQPLPVWTSWYIEKLPHWFQQFSVVVVFIIELILPWLIFAPRRFRYIAFGGITLLMFLIAATGNYNFFNLLTVVLAITLLDDRAWPRSLRKRIHGADWPMLAAPTRWRTFVLVPFAAFVIIVGLQQAWEAAEPSEMPGPTLESKLHLEQFMLVNSYGLFRQMTETRPEIILEVSNDRVDWKPYEFRWKPGDPARRPGFNSPHQPRLDWQMWFEALRLEEVFKVTGKVEASEMSPWFQSFLLRLFENEPSVVGLLQSAPFPDVPPKYIRVLLYQYRFTDTEERRATGNWWHREKVWTGPAWSIAQ